MYITDHLILVCNTFENFSKYIRYFFTYNINIQMPCYIFYLVAKHTPISQVVLYISKRFHYTFYSGWNTCLVKVNMYLYCTCVLRPCHAHVGALGYGLWALVSFLVYPEQPSNWLSYWYKSHHSSFSNTLYLSIMKLLLIMIYMVMSIYDWNIGLVQYLQPFLYLCLFLIKAILVINLSH